MSSDFACLVIADESPEFPAALAYAAHLAYRGGWRLVVLRVIEPAEPGPWAGVTDEMKRQALERAAELLEKCAGDAASESGVQAEGLTRQGELKGELRKLLDEQPAIKLLVLAAGSGASGPGPLVSQLARGQTIGARPVPVVIVPAGLPLEEVRRLANPIQP